MVAHTLKTEAQYFDAVKCGDKNFEVRRNDRGFQKGDTVILERWDRDEDGKLYYDDEVLTFQIGWFLQGGQFGIEPGYCVFCLAAQTPEEDK